MSWTRCTTVSYTHLDVYKRQASNNDAARVRPFADRVGLQFVSMACKPLQMCIRDRPGSAALGKADFSSEEKK